MSFAFCIYLFFGLLKACVVFFLHPVAFFSFCQKNVFLGEVQSSLSSRQRSKENVVGG